MSSEIQRIWHETVRTPRMVIRACLCLFLFILSGCTGLRIPAPDARVNTLPEPPIENSTITLPVSVSLEAILRELGLSASAGEGDGTSRKDIIAGNIRRFLRRQASKKDNKLVQNMYVREQAGKAWGVLQEPVKLKNGLFLLLNPQSISVSPVTEDGDTIQFVIGLVAKPKLAAGLPAPAKAQPLPAISVVSSPPGPGFHITLESEFSFDVLARELTERLKDRPYAAGGQSVAVEKVKLYGSGDSLVAAVTVKGSVNGTVYLAGSPTYDPSTRSLSVGNMAYTLETKNILAKAAAWLMHTELQEALARRASWPLGGRVDAGKEMLSAALNRNLNKHMRVSGKIQELRPLSAGITSTGVKAVLEADGTVEMHISQ